MTVGAAWASLLLSIAASLLGQTLLKAGSAAADFRAQLFDVRSIGGLIAYAAAALLYMLALRRLPMSMALPFTAISYVAVAMIGRFGFDERLSPLHIAAIAVICVGTLMLARASA